jgi:hypothetical protein
LRDISGTQRSPLSDLDARLMWHQRVSVIPAEGFLNTTPKHAPCVVVHSKNMQQATRRNAIRRLRDTRLTKNFEQFPSSDNATSLLREPCHRRLVIFRENCAKTRYSTKNPRTEKPTTLYVMRRFNVSSKVCRQHDARRCRSDM